MSSCWKWVQKVPMMWEKFKTFPGKGVSVTEPKAWTLNWEQRRSVGVTNISPHRPLVSEEHNVWQISPITRSRSETAKRARLSAVCLWHQVVGAAWRQPEENHHHNMFLSLSRYHPAFSPPCSTGIGEMTQSCCHLLIHQTSTAIKMILFYLCYILSYFSSKHEWTKSIISHSIA